MFIAVFVAVVSVMAGILFRENVDPEEDHMTFADFYVSYLGMYQVSCHKQRSSTAKSIRGAKVLQALT